MLSLLAIHLIRKRKQRRQLRRKPIKIDNKPLVRRGNPPSSKIGNPLLNKIGKPSLSKIGNPSLNKIGNSSLSQIGNTCKIEEKWLHEDAEDDKFNKQTDDCGPLDTIAKPSAVKKWFLGQGDKVSESGGQLFKDAVENSNEIYSESMLRMPSDTFDSLLQKVTPIIAKADTIMRESISACVRLEVTLTYLATGWTFRRLNEHCNISKASISKMIPETCSAIYQVLKDDYFKVKHNVPIAT